MDGQAGRRVRAIRCSRDAKEFLPEIYREPSNAAQDPDARISKTLAKCSALFVRLSEEQATLAHRIDFYTRWLIVLTVMLVHAYKVRPRKGRRGLSKPLRVRLAIAVHLVIPLSGTGRVPYPPDGRGRACNLVMPVLATTRDVLQRIQVPNLNV